MTNEEQKKLNKELFKAVQEGKSLEEIKGYIEAGADVNAKNLWGITPIMYAQTAEATKLFLDAGAAIEVSIMEKLNKEEPKRRRIRRKGEVSEVKKNEPEMVEIGKRSALMYVKTAEQVKLLIEAGADVNVKDERGKGVLVCYLGHNNDGFNDNKPAFLGDLEVVKALLDAGVNTQGEVWGEDGDEYYCMSAEKFISKLDESELKNTILRSPSFVRMHIEGRKETIKAVQQHRKKYLERYPEEKVSGVGLADDIARRVISGKETRTITPEVGAMIKRKKAFEK